MIRWRPAFALPIALLSVAAQAGARQDATVLMATHPEARAFQERYGFADAVIAGDTIYLSGIVAGAAPDEKDLSAAYERAYRQIGDVLKRAGASWDDVVDITSFHTDVSAQLDAMAAVQRKYIRAPFPAWTAIDVDRLVPDDGLTEIKIVARRAAAPQQGER